MRKEPSRHVFATVLASTAYTKQGLELAPCPAGLDWSGAGVGPSPTTRGRDRERGDVILSDAGEDHPAIEGHTLVDHSEGGGTRANQYPSLFIHHFINYMWYITHQNSDLAREAGASRPPGRLTARYGYLYT